MSITEHINILTFNQMSDEKYSEIIPTEGEFYCTPDYINLPLLTCFWFDHIVNDISWLRADTFSWQSGDLYVAVYEHLVDDYINGSEQTETINGVTINYRLSQDGHKICLSTQETNISNLYDSTGVSWYYILDTENTRFKLPRTKFGFTGLRNGVGNYVAPGLPNITGYVGKICEEYQMNGNLSSGAFYGYTDSAGYSFTAADQTACGSFNFDASRCSSIYGNSTTVQPPATQMYLYFFVGEFTHTTIEQIASLNTELFNGKADLSYVNTKLNADLSNLPSNVKYITETYSSGTQWYRKWSDGWIEQGGEFSCTTSNWHSFTFPKAFTTTNYTICGSGGDVNRNARTSGGNGAGTFTAFMGLSTTGATCYSGDDASFNNTNVRWYACGY